MRSRTGVSVRILLTCLVAGAPAANAQVAAGNAQVAAGNARVATPKPGVPTLSPLVGVLLANQLAGAGKAAFHVEVRFQVFGADGKPFEQGTAEEWWSQGGGSRFAFKAPSFGSVGGSGAATVTGPEASRSLELAKQLLGAVTAPAASLARGGMDFILGDRVQGTLRLHCMQPGTLGQGGGAVGIAAQTTVCFDDGETIRSVIEPGMVISRSDDALFHGTRVTRKVRLVVAGKQAIAGEVTTLER